MASCTTDRWGNSNSPYLQLNVSKSSSTDTTVTLSWSLVWYEPYTYYASASSAYEVYIDGSTVKSSSLVPSNLSSGTTIASGTKTVNKSAASRSVSIGVWWNPNGYWNSTYSSSQSGSSSISIAAVTTYTITYDANGGSGAPSAQTKTSGSALTISSTVPTKTGHTFQSWNTKSDGTGTSYSSGGTIAATTNSNMTLYAIWKANTYTVTFDANGGSGAPSAQTKTYGVDLTLSSTIPTRTNYNFLGWATAASSNVVSYVAGATYTENSAVTLYAVWELAYVYPSINNLKVERCTINGTQNEEGTYFTLAFDWVCDQTIGANPIKSITYSIDAGDEISIPVDTTKTSGSVAQICGGSLSAETSHTIKVTVTDSTDGSTPRSALLSAATFVWDAIKGNKGISFGKPASKEGYAEFAYKAQFNDSAEFSGEAAFASNATFSGDVLIVDAELEALWTELFGGG